MADHFHFAVAWDWEHDREFVEQLERNAHDRHILFYSISHHNTLETLRHLQRHDLTFSAFLDRAADTDPNFAPLLRWVRKSRIRIFNRPQAMRRAADKAVMHRAFLAAGIEVPFSIIISPYTHSRAVTLSLGDLARLGRPFIIKPANTTGGGVGVILGAESLKDILQSRQHHTSDRYLLQERIVPATLNGQRAWFRVFWVCGQVLPCWWDDQTHLYAPLDRKEIARHGLRPLITIAQKIHDVCLLDFFSTEIAVTESGRPVVVDYVNEICDMRLQSLHPDGVPDEIVDLVCARLVREVRRTIARPQSDTE